ncbi:winged helix-turn-helix transcriptional regulator [Cohnella sp. REN36]|uniref:winged helix-turn-helix transcriptional regulator n=1 Tax=Cohnella sp. REN36 TaxID=2887347 RepID=UPI001D144ED3|nr:winged helix-turn-helix transcriptional regulator [Cohnella sp. REN36]
MDSRRDVRSNRVTICYRKALSRLEQLEQLEQLERLNAISDLSVKRLLYKLSEIGKSLQTIIVLMCEWGERYIGGEWNEAGPRSIADSPK